MSGRAWKFGDDISTDLIAAGRYAYLRTNMPELTKHVLEDARDEFRGAVKPGDFVVGGRNFGLGSSREHAPTIIKMAGVSCVAAKSFARIFFRNCINIGLPAVRVDTDRIDEGDELELDLRGGVLRDITKGIELEFPPMPAVMTDILEAGGLVPYLKKNKGFVL
ncbi:MAG: 3-isopropylmalate dehydratase small subunit [Nitrospirae bacterium]|nr:3-isopropylmalate dehydratase small subunit [Nitrospirota bacterium]